MKRYDYHQPYDPYEQRKRVNAGFRVGFVAGLIMVGIHLALLFFNGGTNEGDLLAWIISWFVYFMAARVAAERHYREQRDSTEPLRGVQGAGVGAALVTSVIVWIYIILRGVFRDAVGVQILVEPIGLYCMIVIDVLIALGLGALGGKRIERKHQSFTGY